MQLPDPATVTVDLSALLPVPHPNAFRHNVTVYVSPGGHITLSQQLCNDTLQQLPALAVEFLIAPDCTLLALRPTEQGAPYRFPKSGRIRDQHFTRRLVESGISLPVRYEVAWNQTAGAWIGILPGSIRSSDTSSNALDNSLSYSKRRR